MLVGRYYYYDHLGSTAALTGGDGEVRLRFAYSAYGELTGITDGTGNNLVHGEDGKITSSMISGAVSETGIRFLYNGQLGVTTDGNGLYHMRARYYNTDIKRFINRDILMGDITNSQSLNRYSYVQGNPVSSTDPFGLCPLGYSNLDWSTIGHSLLDIVGIFWDGADLINALWYTAEGNYFMAGVCLLSALPMLGSFAGGTIKAVATGTKYLNKAETVAKYLTLGTKFVSHTAQATMSGIDTYYAAVDAYEAYKAGELGAEEILNLGLAATGTILSTGAAISSGRGLYNLMCSDGVGCKVLTGITGEPHCFVAGTLVSTEDGQRAIEEVEAGDKVWAYDEETGGKALKEVEEVFVSETDKLIHVETDKEEIITTELHPFYVEGLGFVQAGCLQEGYELVCLDGGKETITDVRVEWLEEPVEVYNFEVADYHTYFVGDGDVLVHNTCANPSGDNTNSTKPINRPSSKKIKIDMDEVISGHTSTGQRARQSQVKDLFPDRMNERVIEKEIRSAYGNAKQVGGSQYDGVNTRIKLQGRGENGVVEMWYNKTTQTIETAYPVYGKRVKIK